MLLCRRILFQFESTRPLQRDYASSLQLRTLRAQLGHRRQIRTRPSVTPGAAALLQLLTTPPESHSLYEPELEAGKDKVKTLPILQAYRHVRLVDRSSLAALPNSAYIRLLDDATEKRLAGLVNQILQDALEICPETQRSSLYLSILSSSAVPLIDSSILTRIVTYFPRAESSLQALKRLPVPHLAVLLRAFADATESESPVSVNAEDSIPNIMIRILSAHFHHLRPPTGSALLAYQPDDLIHASFAYVERLLQLSANEHALKLFRMLVASGNLPSEAVQTVPGVEEFDCIVRYSLIRACLHWRWHPLAAQLLKPLLDSSPSPPVISLAIDAIYACLNEPLQRDLRACRALIVQMHYIAPLPNGIIRQFYLAAEDINDVEDARELFSFTHWSQIVETHRYPPPSRTAIPWLTKALLESHSPLAKVMGEDIYALNLPLAPEHRPAIVSGLASQGHAIVARDLWTRYAQAPRDGATFRGHPTTMLRMVSLLQHLIRREQESMRLAPASAYPPGDDTEPQLIQDFRGILEHVLTSFAAAHEPLETADHRVLTSYTRACFVTGDYVRGINVLKMMLKRREVPDVFDINVLVSAVAEHDPRTAAGLVERMANKGLEPDRITYGTIMHHALSHGDSGLVQQMVKQIRGLRTCFLTYKSIVSLIRGSLSFDTQSPLTQRAKLRGVMNLIKSVGGSTVVNSPHIGKFLVLRALEMDDPVMAYRFWDLLLARSVGWHDREQAYLRGRISNATVAHHKRGWIKDHQRQAMISHLRARTPAVR